MAIFCDYSFWPLSTYVNIYQTIENGFTIKKRLCRAIEEYNKCEEQRNKLATVAKAVGEENAKLVVEKAELLKQLQAQQVDL